MRERAVGEHKSGSDLKGTDAGEVVWGFTGEVVWGFAGEVVMPREAGHLAPRSYATKTRSDTDKTTPTGPS